MQVHESDAIGLDGTPGPVPLPVVCKHLLTGAEISQCYDVCARMRLGVWQLMEAHIISRRIDAIVDESRQARRASIRSMSTGIDVALLAETHEIALVGNPHGFGSAINLAAVDANQIPLLIRLPSKESFERTLVIQRKPRSLNNQAVFVAIGILRHAGR
jgi:hypothetical protein